MSDKTSIALNMSEEMIQEIRDHSIRLDRSMSWVVQTTWKIAGEQIANEHDLDDLGPPLAEEVFKQSFFVPMSMYQEIDTAAAVHETSRSHIVAIAWSIARTQLPVE